jgi:hypothetical protein
VGSKHALEGITGPLGDAPRGGVFDVLAGGDDRSVVGIGREAGYGSTRR